MIFRTVKLCHIPNKSMAFWVDEECKINVSIGNYDIFGVEYCMICGKKLEIGEEEK